MASWDAALMAFIASSAIGFLMADAELRRVRVVQAMRRCLLRMNDLIRYERLPLGQMLLRIDLRATPQEKELCRLLHQSAKRLEHCANPQLMLLFAGESAKAAWYGVLEAQDREAFEAVLSELGRTGRDEQLRLIDEADERMRLREEELRRRSSQRAQMIRTLGLSGGAAMFLILI